MNTSNPFLTVAIEAAQAAGHLIKGEYEKTQAFHVKADASLTTATDSAAEALIIEKIQTAFPDHGIFSEEIGQKTTGEKSLWIIDPLDGTLNFIRHLPGIAVSIALVHDGHLTLGVVYDITNNRLFSAAAGQGATLNGRAIHISQETAPPEAVVSFSRGAQHKERFGSLIQKANENIRAPRVSGSTALSIAYTAAGQHDAHIASNCYLYDAAAPAFIAMEAGATIIGFDGQPWQPDLTNPMSTSDFIVANSELGQSLVSLLR